MEVSNGQLLEYGLAIPKGMNLLRCRLTSLLEDAENELTPMARELFSALREELCVLDDRVKQADKQVKHLAQDHLTCQRLMKIPGIGPLNATALVDAVGNAGRFKNGRELSTWLGLVRCPGNTALVVNLAYLASANEATAMCGPYWCRVRSQH